MMKPREKKMALTCAVLSFVVCISFSLSLILPEWARFDYVEAQPKINVNREYTPSRIGLVYSCWRLEQILVLPNATKAPPYESCSFIIKQPFEKEDRVCDITVCRIGSDEQRRCAEIDTSSYIGNCSVWRIQPSLAWTSVLFSIFALCFFFYVARSSFSSAIAIGAVCTLTIAIITSITVSTLFLVYSYFPGAVLDKQKMILGACFYMNVLTWILYIPITIMTIYLIRICPDQVSYYIPVIPEDDNEDNHHPRAADTQRHSRHSLDLIDSSYLRQLEVTSMHIPPDYKKKASASDPQTCNEPIVKKLSTKVFLK